MLRDYLENKPILETPRLILRPLTPDDVPDLRRWLARDEIYTYWGRPASKGEREPELMFVDPRPWVKRKPSPDFKWGVISRDTNAVIGDISVFDIENSRMGSVGYRFDPELWGQGYATETCRELIRYAFEVRDCAVLAVSHFPFNQKSKRVIKKLGFTYEGVLRHAHALPDGSVSDLVCYSLLKSEYEVHKQGK